MMTGVARVTGLTLYPIKGCRGCDVDEVVVTEQGFVGDRVFAVLSEGQRVNQKQLPALKYLACRWHESTLTLMYPGHQNLTFSPVAGSQLTETFRGQQIPLIEQSDEVNDWLSEALQHEVRLVRSAKPIPWFLPHPEFQRVHGQPQAKFVDAAPLLLAAEGSLADLNGRLDEPVDMRRFRPNLVVDGLDPFQEDTVDQWRFPDVNLHRVTVCERCAVVTFDPDSDKTGKEPLQTLSQHRRRDNDYAGGVMFGVYLSGGDGVLRVGDPFQQE